MSDKLHFRQVRVLVLLSEQILLSRQRQSKMSLQFCVPSFNPVIGITGHSYLSLADFQFGVFLSSGNLAAFKNTFLLRKCVCIYRKANLLNSMPNYL